MTTAVEGARDALAQRVREVLEDRNVREVRMFGGLSFMVDERMAVAAGRDGDLLVRINPDHYDDLLRRGAEQARMGSGRPMGRGWLTVRSTLIESDQDLAFWVMISINSRNANN